MIEDLFDTIDALRAEPTEEMEMNVSDVEKLAAKCHKVYTEELRRQGAENRHPDDYEKLLEPIKDIDRALARLILQRTDALIAGAVAEVSKKISVHWLFEIKCSHGEQTDVAICACGLWQSAPQPTVGDAVERWVEHALDGLTTDAARLALEERLRAERLKISQSCIDVAVSCRAEDVAQRLRAIVDDDRAWLAEREAKLIADTRLEESKFWWNVHRSLSHEGVSNCSMCEHHRANRAAVQGGASRDDS